MKKLLALFGLLFLTTQEIFSSGTISGKLLLNAGDAIFMKPNKAFQTITNGAGMTTWSCTTMDKFGNVIMGGTYKNTVGNRFAIAIINPNKVSENALVILPAFSTIAGLTSNDNCTSITTDSQGSIIIAGTSTDQETQNSYFAVAKLTPKNGILDTSFGKNGMVRITQPIANQSNNNNDQCNAVAVTKNSNPDSQKIILSGISTDIYGTSYFAIVQLTNQGGLDASFGKDGRLYISTPLFNGRGTGLAGGENDQCNAISLDASNNIILTGTSAGQSGSTYFTLVKIPAAN